MKRGGRYAPGGVGTLAELPPGQLQAIFLSSSQHMDAGRFQAPWRQDSGCIVDRSPASRLLHRVHSSRRLAISPSGVPLVKRSQQHRQRCAGLIHFCGTAAHSGGQREILFSMSAARPKLELRGVTDLEERARRSMAARADAILVDYHWTGALPVASWAPRREPQRGDRRDGDHRRPQQRCRRASAASGVPRSTAAEARQKLRAALRRSTGLWNAYRLGRCAQPNRRLRRCSATVDLQGKRRPGGAKEHQAGSRTG